MKGLNLSKFHKISEDKNSATMRHDDGHILVIAKGPLPPLHRKQLEKLPIHLAEGSDGIDSPTASPLATADQPNGADIPPDPDTSQEQTPQLASADSLPGNPEDAGPSPASVPDQAGPPAAAPLNPLSANEGAYRAEQAANLAGAQAIGTQGQSEVTAANAIQKAIALLPSQQDIVNNYKAKDDQLMQAFQNKTIDPNQYWNQKGTGGKIAGGIGMILSGMGGALAHQTPMAQQVIDNAINRDADAQKNDQTKSMNLWKMNREAMGNDLAANLATKNQLLLGYQTQLQSAASQAKGPVALANAQMANSKIEQELNMNRFKLSLMNPTSDGADPSQKVQFLVPPERQQRVFDEIGAAQDTAKNAPGILNSFDKAANNIHGADFVPGMQNADQKSLHTLLGPTFKDVEGTVRQAAMDNLFGNITPQFGDNKNTIITKRNALLGYLQSKSSAPTAKGFGIDLSRYPSTHIAPQAPEIRYDAQGRGYVQDPRTGKPVRVK
jgi:hypothetical protein